MTWDTPEPPRRGGAWKALAAVIVLVAVGVVGAGGMGGEATGGGDPEVLDIRTAEPEELQLPRAPGAVASETAARAPESEPVADPAATPTDDPVAVITESAPVLPDTGPVRIVALAQRLGPGGGGGSLESIDLATGVRHRTDLRAPNMGVPQLAPVQDGGVAVADGLRLDAYGAELDQRGTLATDRPFAVYPTQSGDRLWVLANTPDLTVRLVDLAGREQFTTTVPGYAQPVGTVGDRLLVSSAGNLSLLDADGGLQTIATGEALAATVDRFALLSCGEDTLECRIAVVDADGRVLRSVAAPADRDGPAAFGFDGLPVAKLSPDGRRLAIPDFSAPSGLAVLDLDTGELFDLPEGVPPGNFGTMAWSPDGTALVVGGTNAVRWIDLETNVVTAIGFDGDVFDVAVLPSAAG